VSQTSHGAVAARAANLADLHRRTVRWRAIMRARLAAGRQRGEPVLLRSRHAPLQLRLGDLALAQVKRGCRRHCRLGHVHAAGCRSGRPGRMAPPPWQVYQRALALRAISSWRAGRVGPRARLAPGAHCEAATARCCRAAPSLRDVSPRAALLALPHGMHASMSCGHSLTAWLDNVTDWKSHVSA